MLKGGLDHPYSFSYKTAPFAVYQTFPSDGSTYISREYPNITIYFNAQIDTSTVRTAFLHPGMNGSLEIGDATIVLRLQTPLAANTTYTITVQTTLKSKGGSNLSSPYTFSFTTGD